MGGGVGQTHVGHCAAVSVLVADDYSDDLTERKWPHGTVLTREQLEAARDGHPDNAP